MQSLNKRKREERVSDVSIYKKKITSELRILKSEFKISNGKYYIMRNGIKHKINDWIESNQIETLTINFNLKKTNFFENIPSRIKVLRLMNTFNYPIDNLPDSVIQLEISGKFNHPIKKLPNNLTHLIFNSHIQNNMHCEITSFPPNLINLQLPDSKINLDNLPPNLIHLNVGCSVDSLDKLPEKITHLTIRSNCPVNNLPESVKYLEFGYNFNQPVDNLPRNIVKITFGGRFNQQVNNLPANLIDLEFGLYFNQPIDNLPSNLKTLKLGNGFRKEITSLPNTLEYISFDSCYLKKLDALPDTIKVIELNIAEYGWSYDINNYLNPDGQLNQILPRIRYENNSKFSPICWKPNLEKIIFNGTPDEPVEIKLIFGDMMLSIILNKQTHINQYILFNDKKINIKCMYAKTSVSNCFVLQFNIV